MGQKTEKGSRYHHGDLQNALIRHSLLIIKAEGVAGLTLRKAARHAGVTHAAPAHHFGDLRGLLAAIAERGFSMMAQQMEAAIHDVPEHDPLRRLQAIGLAYIEFAIRNPEHFHAMHHPSLSDKTDYPGLRKESSRSFDLLNAAVEECQQRGVIVKGDTKRLSAFAWSTVHGFAVLAVDGQLEGKGLDVSALREAENMTNLIYSGLGTR